MSRICLYFRREPERDRWVPGDRFVRPIVRRIAHGKPRPGGVDKVFINLCLGLDRLGISYQVNLPFNQVRGDDRVGVLGVGRYALQGYDRPNAVVAGIALVTYTNEWPTLCDDYPIASYLQHSEWASNVYRPFFEDRCRIWPVGIDTHLWSPAGTADKRFDFLIYDKILWQRDRQVPRLLDAVRGELARRKLSYMDLRYGAYDEPRYRAALRSCRAMIFLCEHESQGIAYQECLASGVPVLAWDQGRYLDPQRLTWGQPEIPATSVPYFDRRCGLRFRDIEEFSDKLTQFIDLGRSGVFAPRDFVVENLTLEECAERFVKILDEAAHRRPAQIGREKDGAPLHADAGGVDGRGESAK